ncbi:MAG: ABC transporter ATP-binding protein [Planctomycetes bacterium]|nr:ABC transporter ATP-binding protein [Planctomycetota bacterium]
MKSHRVFDAGPGGDILLRARGLAAGYGRTAVLEGIDLEVRRGEFVAIIGPNGCGKTTLLRVLLGLLRPRRGIVERAPGLRFGYAMQRQSLDPIFPLTVREIVRMARIPRRRLLAGESAEDIEAVRHAMEISGVAALARQPFRDLSGGQKQRVLIARALAAEPDVVILDEPTTDLDIAGEVHVMEVLERVHAELGSALIVVTHLLQVVLDHAHRVGILRDGHMVSATIEDLGRTGILAQLYGINVEVEEVRGHRFAVASSCREHAARRGSPVAGGGGS